MALVVLVMDHGPHNAEGKDGCGLLWPHGAIETNVKLDSFVETKTNMPKTYLVFKHMLHA